MIQNSIYNRQLILSIYSSVESVLTRMSGPVMKLPLKALDPRAVWHQSHKFYVIFIKNIYTNVARKKMSKNYCIYR